MTLREEFENEIKTNKGGMSLLFETSNQHYIEWLECKVKNISSNTVLDDVLLEQSNWLMVNSSLEVEKIVDLKMHLQKRFI